MATLISYEQAWSELRRIQAERNGDWADEPDSIREAARALLNSANPPTGEDEAFCLRILGGNVIAG